MQKRLILIYLLICTALLLIMGASKYKTDHIRGAVNQLLMPVWASFSSSEQKSFFPSSQAKAFQEQTEQLSLDNLALQQKIAFLENILLSQSDLKSSLEIVPEEFQNKFSETYKKTVQKSVDRLNLRFQSVPARVVARSLDLWNQSLWINCGLSDNAPLNTPVIAKNSPVVVGNSIVGVIDYTANHYSRVRLLTDPSLHPSVRVVRGGEAESLLYCLTCQLTQQCLYLNELPLFLKEKQDLITLLEKLKKGLNPSKDNLYLAKGELSGYSNNTRNQDSFLLSGTGFNYDFADSEGPARDLSSGKRTGQPNSCPLPLLQQGDLLVTTGMDGVFPPGFHVATVTHIHPLQEGDYYYSLEAVPTAPRLEEANLVFVLPPYTDQTFQQLQ